MFTVDRGEWHFHHLHPHQPIKVLVLPRITLSLTLGLHIPVPPLNKDIAQDAHEKRQKEIRELTKKRWDKAVLVDRISSWLFSTSLILLNIVYWALFGEHDWWGRIEGFNPFVISSLFFNDIVERDNLKGVSKNNLRLLRYIYAFYHFSGNFILYNLFHIYIIIYVCLQENRVL